jgi:2-oxo-4-hydroxy-4-carboxy-5-ureidoimidazoline decarboxylase
VRLEELNALDEAAAEQAFLACCGSTRWAARMVAARPFATEESMAFRADVIWSGLGPSDWLEAFAAHPRIGSSGKADKSGGAGGAESAGGAGTAGWSAQEQAGVASAPDGVRARLARLNRDYEARFGYIFIVCATGRSADEMAAMLERRLNNDRDDEMRVAAGEQRTITRLRLLKLLAAT